MSKSPSASPAFNVREFFARLPNNDACPDHVMEVRYGMRHACEKCGVESHLPKIKGRRAFSCVSCGHHVYFCAGTIFEESRTKLTLWFYTIYLFVTMRHGVSVKELQRQLGVTYKTAWRMGQQIRTLIVSADGFEMLQGHVELDEAYVGDHRPNKRGRGAAGKTIVFDMKQREGRMVTEVIPNVKKFKLRDATLRNVEPGPIVSTDELMSYDLLTADDCQHGQVRHGAKDFSHYDYRLDAMVRTNHVESFSRLFNKSIASTHVYVSPKYMQRYLSERTFRQNRRAITNGMFDLLIGAAKPPRW
jgi:transposase